jgi:acyl-CoA thioester hydrolase
VTKSDTKRSTVSSTEREFYKLWTDVTLRYGDTDRQGHINNAAYCTFFESGRVAFLCHEHGTIADDGFSFVIAKLSLDFLKEMNFPGTVEVGTRVNQIGKSSFTCGQALFKNGECCSTAESVIVLTDDSTRRSAPLPEKVLKVLRGLQ